MGRELVGVQKAPIRRVAPVGDVLGLVSQDAGLELHSDDFCERSVHALSLAVALAFALLSHAVAG